MKATIEGVVRYPPLLGMTTGLAALHHCHAAVGRSQVDSDDLRHVACSLKVSLWPAMLPVMDGMWGRADMSSDVRRVRAASFVQSESVAAPLLQGVQSCFATTTSAGRSRRSLSR